MATPARKEILDNIETTLAAILTAGGYNTDVVTVEKLIRDHDDVAASLRPWIGFMARPEQFGYLPGGQIRVVMPIFIGFHLTSSSEANRNTDLANLHDDIVAALGSDPTRGGNAVSTMITTAQDDLGDPDNTDSQGRNSTGTIEAQVVYMRTTGST